MKKKLLGFFLLISALMMALCVSAYAEDYSTATAVVPGTTYTGKLSETNTQDVYKITLSKAGQLSCLLTCDMDDIWYSLNTNNSSCIWSCGSGWDSASGQGTQNQSEWLQRGTYYLTVERRWSDDAAYNFKFTFNPCTESFYESDTVTDNTIAEANAISMGTTYYGLIAWQDGADLYKITMPNSGLLTVNGSAIMDDITVKLFNAVGDEVTYVDHSWNSAAGQNIIDASYYLNSGTYYLSFAKSWGDSGTYNFKVSSQSSGESFKESQTENNNDFANADKISLDTKYKGVLTMNDDRDFYKFTMPAKGDVRIYATAYMDDSKFCIYQANGTEVWSANGSWNSAAGFSTVDQTITLAKGTYYFESVVYWGDLGNYNFKLSRVAKANTITASSKYASYSTKSQSIKLGAKATGGKLAYTSSNSKVKVTTAGVVKLPAKFSGKVTITITATDTTGTYKTATKKITVNVPKATKITSAKSVTGKKMTIRWSKVTGASGYQVKVVKGSATKTFNASGASTLSKTITGLSKGSIYKVYVRSYKTVSGKKYYSAWTSVKYVEIVR